MILAAWRNFSRNLKRYRILILALLVISTALVVVSGTLFGLQEAVRTKASRYFAGDLVVLGHTGNGTSEIVDVEPVITTVNRFSAAHEKVETVSVRSTYYESSFIEFFYVGYWTRQRRLVGVEWSRERPILADFDFIEGGVPADDDEKSILISNATADHLGIAVGEELTISIISDRGRRNTGDYLVSGIYHETSFFGYTAYLHRRALNRLREAPEDTVNEIGLYLASDAADEILLAQELTEAIAEEGLPTFSVLTDRDAYNTAASQPRDQREYGVVTLSAQLAEINDLLTAITIIAAAIMVLFLGIVVVGVGNTYTMVVWERTREIGTLRAMGMQRPRMVFVFLIEALFLGGSAVIVGGASGVALLAAIERWVTFPPNAFTTLFLTAGRLAWTIPPWSIPAMIALVIGSGLVGAGRAALRAGNVHPVEAMRQES